MDNKLSSWPLIWTAITAIGTWGLVLATWWLVKKQSQASRDELRVKFQLSFEDKFEGRPMIHERKSLAKQLLDSTPHDQIQEDVMNFFESAGTLLRRGYLDKEMAWVGFGYYVFRWWNACKDYVFEERRQNNDETIFEEFEHLVTKLYKVESAHRGRSQSQLEPSRNEVTTFLEAERDLT